MFGERAYKREIVATVAGGFFSVAIKPPLSAREVERLPLPTYANGSIRNPHDESVVWIEQFENGSTAVIYPQLYQESESPEVYANRLAKKIGNCVVHPEVLQMHPESIYDIEPLAG